MPDLGFIHIGKTGGTALKSALRCHVEKTGAKIFFLRGHTMSFARMRADYPELRALFFVRDPAARFVSGFNSRLRQGRPRHNVPWSPAEVIAFKEFATANQLAEALSDGDPPRQRLAAFAMNQILHVANRLTQYLGPISLLQSERDSIFYIGDVATFPHDFAELVKILDIDHATELPSDDVGAHRSPADLDRRLSPTAVRNLQAWYREDYEIYRWCQDFRSSQSARLNSARRAAPTASPAD
jgi:sulfotransferase famil protein